MKMSQATLTIPSDLGYGASGSSSTIPGGGNNTRNLLSTKPVHCGYIRAYSDRLFLFTATLVFEVELIQVM